MRTFKILVSGRVQGVNFRNMIRDFCLQLGINGQVKNLDDGRVEILIECDGKSCKKLVGWLKSNPGFSKVEEVKVEKVKENVKFRGFEIVKEGNFLKDQIGSFKNFLKKI
jgi:acylphosphatase